MNAIDSFSGENRWLSNFWSCEVYLDGEKYDSVEKAYVAAKTLDPLKRKVIAAFKTAGECKRFGKTLKLRPNWNDLRLSIMEGLLKEKFNNNSELAAKLIKTRGIELIEGNYWGDTFWGVCKGVGQNNMGKLLMKIREELFIFRFPKNPNPFRVETDSNKFADFISHS